MYLGGMTHLKGKCHSEKCGLCAKSLLDLHGWNGSRGWGQTGETTSKLMSVNKHEPFLVLEI